MDMPEEVKIEVTPLCNGMCEFCVNKATFAKNGRKNIRQLGTHEMKFIIDKISDSGVKSVRFTGGEPLIRSDIFELMEYAKASGLSVRLNTNCTLIDKKNIQEIKGTADAIIISILSYSGIKTDEIMGIKGAFEKKENAIRMLHGSKVQIRTCTVATKQNIEDLEKIFNIVKSLKPDYWFILRQTPNEQNPDPMAKKDVRNLIDKLIKIKETGHAAYTVDNAIPFCAYDPEKSIEFLEEGSKYIEGHSKLVINPEGNIQIDYAIETPVGNIFRNNILNAWNSKFARDFRELRLVPEVCKSCRYIRKCRGGSRFCAKTAYGKYDAMDPLADPNTIKELQVKISEDI